MPSKDFIQDYLRETIVNVKQEIDEHTKANIDNLKESTDLMPFIKKHEESIFRMENILKNMI